MTFVFGFVFGRKWLLSFVFFSLSAENRMIFSAAVSFSAKNVCSGFGRSNLVYDPTNQQPGFDLPVPRQTWTQMNRFCTGQAWPMPCLFAQMGPYHIRPLWLWSSDNELHCRHDLCPLTKFNSGLVRVHEADSVRAQWSLIPELHTKGLA